MTTTTTTSEASAPPLPPERVESDDAWAFCWQSLLRVSRTFSRPIELLPAELRAATTCGYLLCRIADTVEDDPKLSIDRRDALYDAFLSALEDGQSPATFMALTDDLDGQGPEQTLAANLDRVLEVFGQLPEGMQRVCSRWISEMVRGMSLYGHRKAHAGQLCVLETMGDLERYCYFVAGTVGQLLTGLFGEAMARDGVRDGDRARQMALHAESFGLGLQMVNILKDQTDDLARGWCFIPRTLWEAQELSPEDLLAAALSPETSAAAHRVVAPVFERAKSHLDDALEYTLAIPADQTGIRLFCLLPLWMAARTLAHAEGNDAMFEADSPVKISRGQVEELIGTACSQVGDDDALRETYARLWA
ncbi:MAG: phytoene/squalene synthase family protein [Persicimonas sp.]